MQTPEFLLWSLEYGCPLRGDQDGTDPERTERQLRAARAVSDARREGRVLEGLAVDPPNGFRIADALAISGGEAAVQDQCPACPANCRSPSAASYAECFGWVVLPDDAAGFHAAANRAVPEVISPTMPRWYGLWMRSPLAVELLAALARALGDVQIYDTRCRDGLVNLIAACQAASEHEFRLHVRLYPPGRVEGMWWRMAPHCPRCKAQWRTSATRCTVCGHVGSPAPDKKRRARGTRPYFPLDRLLGSEQAVAFMDRYRTFQARQVSLDQPPALPPPAPPDSPPAD